MTGNADAMRRAINGGRDEAERVLAAINLDPPPQPRTADPLRQLVAWVAIAHDTRWLDVHVTVDGHSCDPVYAVEAHTLDLCQARPGQRVDHVYRGAGRTLIDALGLTLAQIHPPAIEGD